MNSTENDEVLEFNYGAAKTRVFKLVNLKKGSTAGKPSCPVCGANKVIYNESLAKNTYSCGYASMGAVVLSKCQGTDS